MKEFWDQRYAEIEYAYGEQPNVFFQQELMKLNKLGKILLPADGEGRNGVFAAQLGWDVYSFDISEEGKKKAEKLAENRNVELNYQVGDFLEMDHQSKSFDAVGLIYSHFPPVIREIYHQRIGKLLKQGGIIIMEGFSTKHLEYNTVNPEVGGSKDEALLFSKEMVLRDFKDFEIVSLEQDEVDLNEGNYHIGKGNVIRFVGIKK